MQDELLYTITERFEGNYLLREIANIQEYNEIVVKEIIKQILKILKTCFSQGYVVDHIKPENLILVKFGQTNYKIKLFFSDPSQYTESDMTPPSSCTHSKQHSLHAFLRGRPASSSEKRFFSPLPPCLRLAHSHCHAQTQNGRACP